MIHEPLEDIVVIDDFYTDPEAVREHALAATYGRENWSYERHFPQGIEEQLASALEGKIVDLYRTGVGAGDFLMCTRYAGAKGIHDDANGRKNRGGVSIVVYLTPDAFIPERLSPEAVGTHFWQHKATGFASVPSAREIKKQKLGLRRLNRRRWDGIMAATELSSSSWEKIATVPYAFNRLIAFPCDRYHSSGIGFGTTVDDARLLHSHLLVLDKSFKYDGV